MKRSSKSIVPLLLDQVVYHFETPEYVYFLSEIRQVFAAAREGIFPEIMAMLNITYYTPIPAILTTLVGLFYLLEDSVISLISYLAFVETIFDTMTVAVLPYYRWKQPNRPRPFRVTLFIPNGQ